jgi:hypothetical protein
MRRVAGSSSIPELALDLLEIWQALFCYQVLGRSVPPGDTTPPTIDNFYVDKDAIILGDTIKFSYSVSDTGGSGLKQVELWEGTDNNGEPVWPDGPTGYVDMQTVSTNNAQGQFDYVPKYAGTYWYGIHVVDNAGNWNDEKNSNTINPTKVFDPNQVDVSISLPDVIDIRDLNLSPIVTWGFPMEGQILNISFDKNSYSAGETANVSITVKNTGLRGGLYRLYFYIVDPNNELIGTDDVEDYPE